MYQEYLTETFSDLFKDNKQITLTYSKSYNYVLKKHLHLLDADNLNNYINIFYFFRYLVYKDLSKKKIPYKPLFFKLADGSTSKVVPIKNIKDLSFKEFYAALACAEIYVEVGKPIINPAYYVAYRSVSYTEPGYILQFFLGKCRKDYAQQAYDYFCQLFYSTKSENILAKDFVLTCNI